MPNLSPEFIENMRALLGAGAEDFLRALEQPPALALRAHRGAEGAARGRKTDFTGATAHAPALP